MLMKMLMMLTNDDAGDEVDLKSERGGQKTKTRTSILVNMMMMMQR